MQTFKRLTAKGRHAAVVVVAEGATPRGRVVQRVTSSEVDQFGHVRLGGIGNVLAAEIERITGTRDPSRHPRPHPAGRFTNRI